MAAKLKAILLAASIGLAPNATFSQQAVAKSTGDLCLDMASIPIQSITEKLKLFAGDVLGKNAELWQEADFQALLTNARNCNGKPEGIDPAVSFSSWNLALTTIYPMVRRITDVTVPLTERYKGIFPVEGGRMLCTKIFDFRKDSVWLTNNSDEVFGTPFEKMTPTQLTSARSFMADCQPALEEVLKLRGKNGDDAAKLIKSINTSIDRDQKIPAVQIDNLVEDLIPVRDGRVIPLAYVSPNTVAVVRRVNTSLLRKVRLQTDDLVLISQWADNVFQLVPEGPDRAYAERVKNAITKQMFPG
jgi:hypothetical protein